MKITKQATKPSFHKYSITIVVESEKDELIIRRLEEHADADCSDDEVLEFCMELKNCVLLSGGRLVG